MIDTVHAIQAGVTLAALQRQSLLDPLDNRMLLCHALG
jgi:release factor glutamine methyltransferase